MHRSRPPKRRFKSAPQTTPDATHPPLPEDPEPTHRTLREAIRGEPDNVGLWLLLGGVCRQLGRAEEAVLAYQVAVNFAPNLPALLAAGQIPAHLQSEAQEAATHIGDRFHRFSAETIDFVKKRYPGERLDRLAEGLHGLASGQPVAAHAEQRPALLGFSDIQADPWYSPAPFPWAETVRDASESIRAEYESVRRARFNPYLRGEGSSTAGSKLNELANAPEWSAFHLYRNGQQHDREAAQCPATVRALESFLPRVRNQMPEVFFSRLEPGGRIVPHHGLMNIRLTVHLGLVVPEDCGIRVGRETRAWAEGDLVIFDDSFEHEAWNRSSSERVVLIFEAWHPDLTPGEIAGVERVFTLRRDWIERAQGHLANLSAAA